MSTRTEEGMLNSGSGATGAGQGDSDARQNEAADRYLVVEQNISQMLSLLLDDDSVRLQDVPHAISYENFEDFEFKDKGGYASSASVIKILDEMEKLAFMDELIRRGEETLSELYTYRAVSKALPLVQASEKEAMKVATHRESFGLLAMAVEKVQRFFYFQRETVESVGKLIEEIAEKHRNGEFVSQILLLKLVKCIDVLTCLDTTKNLKNSMNNDFSFYRRAYQYLLSKDSLEGLKLTDAGTQQEIYSFLANRDTIRNALHDKIKNIGGLSDILVAMTEMCLDMLRDEMCLLPSELHCIQRSVPNLIILMETPKSLDDEEPIPVGTILNPFKHKKILALRERISVLVGTSPVVPFFGDMQVSLELILQKSANYERSWLLRSFAQKDLEQKFLIINFIDMARRELLSYITMFSKMFGELRLLGKGNIYSLKPTSMVQIKSFVVSGIKLISKYSSIILEQLSWKHDNPRLDLDFECEDYEKAVRHNYSHEEKDCLIEIASLVKSVTSMMSSSKVLLDPIIRCAIHHEMQEFIQQNLREMLRRVSRKKRTYLRGVLLQIRSFGTDWIDGEEAKNDPALLGKKWNRQFEWKVKDVVPSPTQLEVIRTLVNSTFYELPGSGSRSTIASAALKDFDADQVNSLKNFFWKSRHFAKLEDYVYLIDQISSFSWLWLKEFHLSMIKGVQFPIEFSLPNILVQHVLSSKNTLQLDQLFYCLEIYNDTGNDALNGIGERYLFDEVQAEFNLCFDQVLYRLATQIFIHFKTRAAVIMLNNSFDKITVAKDLQATFFDSIIGQKRLQLLGRSVNMNELLSQRVNNLIKDNIDNAITKFEHSPMTSCFELESVLTVTRMTYKLLREHLNLDSFDELLAQVDESVAIVSHCGRISRRVTLGMITELIPQYMYDAKELNFKKSSRAARDGSKGDSIKTPPQFLYGTKALNSIVATYLSEEVNTTFVNHDTIACLVRLLGKQKVPLVIGEINKYLELKFGNVILQYFIAMLEAIPKQLKLPDQRYLLLGCHGFFELKLADLLNYGELYTEIMPGIAELGNALYLIRMFEDEIGALDTILANSTSKFLSSGPLKYRDAPSQTILDETLGSLAGAGLDLTTAESLEKGILFSKYLYLAQDCDRSISNRFLQWLAGMIDVATQDSTFKKKGEILSDESSLVVNLMSTVLFAFTRFTVNENLSSEDNDIGDGFIPGFTVLLHALDLQYLFRVFDFSYHLISIAEILGMDESTDVKVKNFVNKSEEFKIEIENMLHLLDKLYPRSGRSSVVAAEAEIPPIPTLEELDKYFEEKRNVGSSLLKGEFNVLPPPPSLEGSITTSGASSIDGSTSTSRADSPFMPPPPPGNPEDELKNLGKVEMIQPPMDEPSDGHNALSSEINLAPPVAPPPLAPPPSMDEQVPLEIAPEFEFGPPPGAPPDDFLFDA